MNKKLFALPLLAGLLLCGCNNNDEAGDQTSKDDNYIEDRSEELDYNEPQQGLLCLSFDTIFENTAGKTGYDAVAGVTKVGNYDTTFSNVCINRMNSNSKPVWITEQNVQVPVVQFKNAQTAAGVITVKNIKATTVSIWMLSSYDYASDFVVKNGETAVAVPSSSEVTKDTTSYVSSPSYPVSMYKITFNVNAAAAADLTIGNNPTSKGARYVRKIVIN